MKTREKEEKIMAIRNELYEILCVQSTEGYWDDEKIFGPYITKEFAAKLKEKVCARTTDDIDRVLFTLMALWIFETKFEDQEGEWRMIAAKAKAYLKKHNVT